MFFFIFVYSFLLLLLHSTSSSNTYVFSAMPNTYIALESWRPCLTGYVRFDIRTNTKDGTLAYIDDRGKFDFFYLKLIEGKLRLLFNLGSDRQAINVNMKINDDQWHTILIKRNGQTTLLSIDHGFAQNSVITHSEDLYFGGAVYNEYEASPFYFGGIPSVLERPSSGNLSSFDVYKQPRFRGQLRNIIYKNCTNSRLIQPDQIDISSGVSILPNQQCSAKNCGAGICLATDNNYTCHCDETNYQGTHCQYERQTNELTFHGKQYLKYDLSNTISSLSELITFEFRSNHYNGLLFQLLDSHIYIQLRQGQLSVEYRLNNHSWYESATKDLDLIDNQWHYVQIKRKSGQITMLIDQYYLPLENDNNIDQIFHFKEIFIGGNNYFTTEKFYGCLKDMSIILNENFTIDLNRSTTNIHEYGHIRHRNCRSLLNPIQFLTSSSYISFSLRNISEQINLSFRFETYSSDSILLYCQSNQDFLGLDLINGFFYLTINVNKQRQRQELFQQRFNDGQSHYFQVVLRQYQREIECNITMDYRLNTRLLIRNTSSKINFHTLTIGGVNPALRWFPTNYFSGIMHRGLIGCFSDLEINNLLINLTKYINYTNNHVPARSGPCSIALSTKRECLCEHKGECQPASNGIQQSCDCSKTGYTGRRCEQLAYHLDLHQIHTLEFDSKIQWSEHINDIAFSLQATRDEVNFLQIRACRLSLTCDSINFSILNGLLHVNFYQFNITSEYPFLLDNQWHSIHLQRFNKKFLLHIDNQVTQQRVEILNYNSSFFTNIWVIFNGNKLIQLEDLRLYEQSIYPKLLTNQANEQIQLKNRLWKPTNTISFNDQQNSYIEIQLNEILCQECQLNSIYFQFRTAELNGLLFFAMIQTDTHKISSSSESSTHRNNQYLILKLVNGYLHLTIFQPSLSKIDNEIDQIQTKLPLNDNHWHHISFHRASDHHLELVIDSNEYYLLTSVTFLDKIYIGRPVEIDFLNYISTIKACMASFTINSHSINLREHIKPNARIRNDCFLDSQCPLQQCHNTGICLDRNQCQCQHTSFQGQFCTQLKMGYSFNNYTPGLIFDQPLNKEKPFATYKLSFGIISKMNNAEIIRINDQIFIELYRGLLRIKLSENESLQHTRLINDGYYHLIQIEYHIRGFLSLSVDNRPITNQFNHRILFDKPLLLLIGQNPIFKYPFQGQLYGLESDIYSIFDLISPTFQRISFAPVRNKSLSSVQSPIIHPVSRTQDEFTHPSCLYQPYDDICIITSDRNSTTLSFSNLTSQSILPRRISSFRSSTKASSKYFSTSTIAYQELTSHLSNSTNSHDIPPLIVSIRTPVTNRFRNKFRWQNLWIFIIPILSGITLCVVLCVCVCVKYRRKDAGVYELEETQRFRPLIVEVPPSPGENIRQLLNSTDDRSKKTYIKSRQRGKRKKSPLLRIDEQREFYI